VPFYRITIQTFRCTATSPSCVMSRGLLTRMFWWAERHAKRSAWLDFANPYLMTVET
jgi:hypothetical protein